MENKAVTISTQLAIFIDSTIARPDLLFNSLNSEIGEVIGKVRISGEILLG